MLCIRYDDVWVRYVPGNKIHVAHMGPTWVLSAPGGPHVGPMNLAIGLVTLRTGILGARY